MVGGDAIATSGGMDEDDESRRTSSRRGAENAEKKNEATGNGYFRLPVPLMCSCRFVAS